MARRRLRGAAFNAIIKRDLLGRFATKEGGGRRGGLLSRLARRALGRPNLPDGPDVDTEPGDRGRPRLGGRSRTNLPDTGSSPRRAGRDLTKEPGFAEGILDEYREYFGQSADTQLTAIAVRQGFDGRPQVVSRAEMDRLIADGRPELWRGVGASPDGKTAAEIHEEMRSGDLPFYGNGDYGNGYYTTTQRESAEFYSDGSPGSLARMTLQPDSRIINYRELERRHSEFVAGLDVDARGGGGDWASWGVLQDPGRFAAALGYDAVEIDDDPDGFERFYLVLNRTALVVEEGGQ